MSRMSPKKKSAARDYADFKMQKVMHEWKEGTLKSSSGQPVTDQKQAIAIGFSEGRRRKRGKK